MIKSPVPDFAKLSKPITFVDAERLQNELRALHSRLEVLESAATTVPNRVEGGFDYDSEDSGEEAIRVDWARTNDDREGVRSQASDADDPPSAGPTDRAPSEHGSESPLRRITGVRENAGAITSFQTDVLRPAEPMNRMVAAEKLRKKGQPGRRKTAVMARTLEIKQLQLAIEARVTSGDLALATNANADKIVALQSSFDSALSDSFRRVQEMVHSQMTDLVQMVQQSVQQQTEFKTSDLVQMVQQSVQQQTEFKTSFDDFEAMISSSGFGDGLEGSEEHNPFIQAITDLVRRIMKEIEKDRTPEINSGAFGALQAKEDYEVFQEYTADRQDAMSALLEDARARLEKAEEAVACTNQKQSELGNVAQKAFSLATDANDECASTRALMGDVRRETLLEARLEAESMVDRAEGRAKDDVQNARDEARIAAKKLTMELRQHIKQATDEMETQKAVILGAKTMSEEAISNAAAAVTLAKEGEFSTLQAEKCLGERLDDAAEIQAAAVAAIYDKMVMDNTELNRVEAQLQRLVSTKEEEISDLRNELARLEISAKTETANLRKEVQDAFASMLLDKGLASGGHQGAALSGVPSGTRPSDGSAPGSRVGIDPEVAGLVPLGEAFRKQEYDTVQKVTTLQRSSVGILSVLRKVQMDLQVLSTKDLFWKAADVKLEAHKQMVGDVCLDVEEATVSRRSRITLPKEAQACLAGNMQRVAKLIAAKADYEVIRELSKLEDPEHADHDWDERVEYLRQKYLQRFVHGCREALDKRAPELRTNFKGEEIREKFFVKLIDALKVALSKYSQTTPGLTLFGKIKLKAKACVACDRAFVPTVTGGIGSTPAGGIIGAGIEPQYLPNENSHIIKDVFRPQNSNGRRLGLQSTSCSSIDPFEVQHSAIGSILNGDRLPAGAPHVFRGGFKLPKAQTSVAHPRGRPSASGVLDRGPPLQGNLLHNQGLHSLHSSEDDDSTVSACTTETGATRRVGSSGGGTARTQSCADRNTTGSGA